MLLYLVEPSDPLGRDKLPLSICLPVAILFTGIEPASSGLNRQTNDGKGVPAGGLKVAPY